MLRRPATLKAAKKNVGFARSNIKHTGVGTAALPLRSGSNLLGRPKYLALLCLYLLKLTIFSIKKYTVLK